MCVFRYRVNVVGNLIVARVYIQFHGTFDWITATESPRPQNGFPRSPGQMIFNSATPPVIDIPAGFLSLLFPFHFCFYLFIFFFNLSRCQNCGGNAERRVFIPPEEIAFLKNHTETGWSISRCFRRRLRSDWRPLTPVWHTLGTNATRLTYIYIYNVKNKTSFGNNNICCCLFIIKANVRIKGNVFLNVFTVLPVYIRDVSSAARIVYKCSLANNVTESHITFLHMYSYVCDCVWFRIKLL